MGLTPEKTDQRPRDWAYMAAFDRKDLPSLEEMARHIRETHNTTMIEDFNLKCEQKLKSTDQSATLDNGLEIKAVTKTGDLVLNGGLDQCIRLVQGTSSVRWSHFGMSPTGSPSAQVTDTVINNDLTSARVSLAWAEPVGMRLLFGGISSQSTANRPNSVKEIGVYNGSSAGAILLNHSTFVFNYPQQDIFLESDAANAPILVSAVIEFCPIG